MKIEKKSTGAKLMELNEQELNSVSGGWFWSGLFVIPFAVGAGIRYIVDPGAYD